MSLQVGSVNTKTLGSLVLGSNNKGAFQKSTSVGSVCTRNK